MGWNHQLKAFISGQEIHGLMKFGQIKVPQFFQIPALLGLEDN